MNHRNNAITGTTDMTNRYSISICDDALHSMSINRANALNECDETTIPSVCIELINAHMRTMIETGRAHLLTEREYVINGYTDEYHLNFDRRVPVDCDDMTDDEQDVEHELSFVASFQIN